MSYRVLVLPEIDRMTLPVLRKTPRVGRRRRDGFGAEAPQITEPCRLSGIRPGGAGDSQRAVG